MDILLATNNSHKLNEFRDIINNIKLGNVNLLGISDVFQDNIEIEETEDTIEGNAYLKASKLFELSNITTIADDTGLEIYCLNGLPGVHLARFAGEKCIDSENRKKVLDMIKNVGDENRNARFRTVICLVDKYGKKYFEGICNGNISKTEKGANGFGYDSIFIPIGFSKTFAEMEPGEKNKLSHRRKAIESFAMNFL